VAQSRGKGKGAKKSAVVLYVVIQVGQDFEVVKKSEASARKKKIENHYRSEIRAYNQAKKAARKAKESFDTPKPPKPVVKVLKKSFKTELDARAYIGRLKAKLQKSSGSGARGKAETFAVIAIDGSVKVVTKSELASLRKEMEAEYKKAVQAYNKARKTAAKLKQKCTDPRPKKQQIKVLGPSFKSMEKARTFMEKYLAKKQKKDSRKKKKSKGKDRSS